MSLLESSIPPFMDPSKVTATADFKNELQLDALDNVHVIMATEQEFAVDIPDNHAQKIATTVYVIDFIAAHPHTK